MAQLAISKDYFAAYARLPRKAQRKADEFLTKFRADSTAASIHLEPLHRMVDPMLRSARIGDDYRVILRAPEKGDVFLILWADHHDEAYRWAATKQTAVHPATGSLQIFDAVHATQAVTTAQPDDAAAPPPQATAVDVVEAPEPAGLFSARSDDELFHAGVPRALLPSVRAVATDDELDLLLPHLPPEAAEVLTALAAGLSLDDALEEVLGRTPAAVGAPPPAPVDVTDVAAALERETTQRQFRLFDGSLDLDTALKHPLDVWRVFLHPQQRRIAQAHTKGPVRVLGGAGTGKTVVALHRAAFLVREVFTRPDDRVLFTTYTTNLADDIRSQLEKLLEPDHLARVEVINIDKWASQYLRTRGKAVRLAFDKDQRDHFNDALEIYGKDDVRPAFYRAEWRDVVQDQGLKKEAEYVAAVRKHRGVPLGRAERRRLWPVFEAYRNSLELAGLVEPLDMLRLARVEVELQRAEDGGAPRYRAVVVDEAQDFSADALRLVRAIAGPEHPDDLFLVGDAHQRIYGRPVSLTACGIQVRGRRSQTLRLNYRTTGSICRWSLGILKGVDVDDLDEGKADRRGYVSVREGPAPSVRVFGSAREEEAALVETVQGILATGVPSNHVCVVARTHEPLKDRFGPALERAGVPTVTLEGGEPRRDGVRLATMHRVKGLEFPVVFLVDVSRGHVPAQTDELRSEDAIVASRALLREKSLLYVAASRARDELHVSAAGTPSALLEGLLRPRSVAPARRPSVPGLAAVAAPRSSSVPAPSVPAPSAAAASVPVPSVPVPSQPAPSAAPVATSPVGIPVETDAPSTVAPAPTEHQTALAAALATPLTQIDMSARLVNWANRSGVATLAELAARTPTELLAERNMGRTSVKEARTIIESRTGVSWEALLASATDGPEVAVGTEATGSVPSPTRVTLAEAAARGWEGMRGALDDEQRAALLDELALPARLRSFVDLRGLKTLGDLAMISSGELASTKNLGRTSVRDLPSAILEHFAAVEAEATLADLGLIESWRSVLQGLEQMPRMILSRRSGVAGQVSTLQEIGATFGVTRERIRQIEAKTCGQLRRRRWAREVRGRVDVALAEGPVSLASLDTHPWWSGVAARPEVARFIVETVLDDAAWVIEVDDEPWLARVKSTAVADAWEAVKAGASALPLPAEVSVLDEVVQPVASTIGPAVARRFRDLLADRARIDGAGRLLAFGDSRGAQLLALLRSKSEPIRVEDAELELGGRFHPPEEVIRFGKGRIGLREHVPSFETWRRKLVPRAAELVRELGPERQWSCIELLDELRDEVDIPDWLTPWVLVALIRASSELAYLGRLRVALPDASEAEGRVFIHEVMEEELRDAGAPVASEVLIERVRSRVPASDLTFNGMLTRPQFIRVDADRIGLLERDVPGGADAIAEAADHAENLLARRDRGLSSFQMHREVTLLSDEHAGWTEELTASVLRSDGRFRFSLSGAIGLEAWESTRVPTRLELIRSALDEADGRVSVDAVLARIEANYGVRPTRAMLPAYGMKLGATLDDEWLVRGRGPTAASGAGDT